jgi:hypothetical protein
MGAVCNPFIIVTLAEVPQADLVKVVEAERARNGARKLDIASSGRDDIGEVELEEVGRADDDFGIGISDEGLCLLAWNLILGEGSGRTRIRKMTETAKKTQLVTMAARLVLVALLTSTGAVGVEIRPDGSSGSRGESVSNGPCFVACLRAAMDLKVGRVMAVEGDQELNPKPALDGVKKDCTW